MRLDICTATGNAATGAVTLGAVFLSFDVPETRLGILTAFRLINCYPWDHDDIVTIKTATNLPNAIALRVREFCNRTVRRKSLILDNGVNFNSLTPAQIALRIG